MSLVRRSSGLAPSRAPGSEDLAWRCRDVHPPFTGTRMRQLRSPGLVVLAGPPQSSPCACTQHRCSRAAAWGGWRRRPQSTTAASAFAAAGAADTAVTKATGYTSLSVSARRACHTLRALPAGGAPVALAAASLATATATPTAAGVPGGAASLSQLVVAAAQPVAKLALFCAVGAWASRQVGRAGWAGERARGSWRGMGVVLD